MANSILDTLKAEIERIVKADVKGGAGKEKLESMLLPGDTPKSLILEAIDQIYTDVVELYSWYFDRASDRSADLRAFSKVDSIPERLKDAVKAVVDDNLTEMRLPPSEIPADLDTPDLGDLIAEKLSGYILNWQKWFWDNLRISRVEEYYELKAINDEIYGESDYGDLTNYVGGVLDGYSDVPYISKELGFDSE